MINRSKKTVSRKAEIDALHEALQESETRYRLVMEATSDGIWDWDVRTHRVHYNPAYTRMLGFDPEEFSGNLTEWLERVHPDDRERALRENQRCIDNEVQQFAVEFRMRTKSGGWKWILGRGMAVERDDSGKALRMIGTHTDITRIKEGERRENMQRWIAALLSTMTHLDERIQLVLDAILQTVDMECGGIYLLDQKNGILRLVCHQGVSEDFVKAVGTYPSDSPTMKLVMAGRPLYTTYEELPVIKSDPQAREGLKAIAVVPIHYEGRVVGCLNAASRTRTVISQGEKTFLETAAAHLGNALGRIRTRQDLEESTRQYAALFELAGDALLVVRISDRRIVDANQAASHLLGFSKRELVDTPWDGMIDASETEDLVDRCLAELNERDACLVEGYLRTRQGLTVPVEISAKPLTVRGEPVLFLMARDISARLRAQEEKERLEEHLRHAQRMESVGRMAGAIAHDFNNLLTPILAYGDMLSRFLDDASPLKRQAKTICEAALKARQLVEQLLAFSRDHASTFEILNLAEKLRDFQDTLAGTMPRDIHFTLSVPATPVWVRADPGQVERMLQHLIANALDAMPDRGTLSILLEQRTFHHESDLPAAGLKPGTYAVLTVADTGIGMNHETLQKIFEPFFSTKPFGRRAGIGLSVVYGIVENHQGKILASSIPGLGTAFEIYLPVGPRPPA